MKTAPTAPDQPTSTTARKANRRNYFVAGLLVVPGDGRGGLGETAPLTIWMKAPFIIAPVYKGVI
jgi:hypothetical protein